MTLQHRHPVLDPLSEGDQAFLGRVLPLLLGGMLVMLVWYACQGRPLTNVDGAPVRPPQFQVDVNQAPWPEISLLPGVGETLARRIVAHRESHGPFSHIDQLTEIQGIGPKLAGGMRPYLMPLPSNSLPPPPNASDSLEPQD